MTCTNLSLWYAMNILIRFTRSSGLIIYAQIAFLLFFSSSRSNHIRVLASSSFNRCDNRLDLLRHDCCFSSFFLEIILRATAALPAWLSPKIILTMMVRQSKILAAFFVFIAGFFKVTQIYLK
jgi:hypothetical protein